MRRRDSRQAQLAVCHPQGAQRDSLLCLKAGARAAAEKSPRNGRLQPHRRGDFLPPLFQSICLTAHLAATQVGAPVGCRFPGAQPVSLDRHSLQSLANEDYWVSWKADGTRYGPARREICPRHCFLSPATARGSFRRAVCAQIPAAAQGHRGQFSHWPRQRFWCVPLRAGVLAFAAAVLGPHASAIFIAP